MNIQKITQTATGLENLLNKELGVIKEKYTADAHHLAANNLPVNGETFSIYWAEHHSKFENLLTQINQHLKSDALLFQVRQTNDAADSSKHELHNKRKELQDTLIDHCRETPQEPEYSPARITGIRTTVALIALFEGMYTTPVFMQIGLSWIESACAASLLAIALTSYYHSVPTVMQRAGTPQMKRIVFLCMWLLPVVFFYIIGESRADYLTQLSQQDVREGIRYSPWLFIITSIVMSTIALLLALLQPDKETRNHYRHYQKWQRTKKDLETKLQAVEEQIKASDNNARTTALSAAQTYEYANSLEHYVITSARSGFEDFKKRIITHKAIPGGPSIHEPYPFEFPTHFNYKTQQPHE